MQGCLGGPNGRLIASSFKILSQIKRRPLKGIFSSKIVALRFSKITLWLQYETILHPIHNIRFKCLEYFHIFKLTYIHIFLDVYICIHIFLDIYIYIYIYIISSIYYNICTCSSDQGRLWLLFRHSAQIWPIKPTLVYERRV